jgi:hypothetical protein
VTAALMVLTAVHALIHFMGFAKAFGLADLTELTQPIGRTLGVLWLAAGLTLLAATVMMKTHPRSWWWMGFLGITLSQVVIFTAWSDARFGTVANLLIGLFALYGFAAKGPLGLRAEYRNGIQDRIPTELDPPVVTEKDLTGLPEPVQRYLRVTGSVGRPVAQNFRAVHRGRIRAGPEDAWMEFTAEQCNFLGEPSRFFLMDARRGGLPVDVLHVFKGGSASMRVRLLSLFQIVNNRGAEMDQAETVTVFNDLCLFAPSALVDPAIRWESLDAASARAHYTLGERTISAVLHFGESGELVDFLSDDRQAVSSDGKTFIPLRWSTPVSEYRDFGERRAFFRGEGRWHPPEGDYVYIEMELLELKVNLTRRPR